MGRRLRAVTNNPIQPANATGCNRISAESFETPSIDFVRKERRREEPRDMPLLTADGSLTSDNISPIMVEGNATAKPARGPAAPILSNTLLLGIRDRSEEHTSASHSQISY